MSRMWLKPSRRKVGASQSHWYSCLLMRARLPAKPFLLFRFQLLRIFYVRDQKHTALRCFLRAHQGLDGQSGDSVSQSTEVRQVGTWLSSIGRWRVAGRNSRPLGLYDTFHLFHVDFLPGIALVLASTVCVCAFFGMLCLRQSGWNSRLLHLHVTVHLFHVNLPGITLVMASTIRAFFALFTTVRLEL